MVIYGRPVNHILHLHLPARLFPNLESWGHQNRYVDVESALWTFTGRSVTFVRHSTGGKPTMPLFSRVTETEVEASAAYLEEVGTTISERYAPIYEARQTAHEQRRDR